MTAAGLRALLLPSALPTPVLAYAVRAARRRRGRHGHGEPQPTRGQRVQGLPRRPHRRPRRGARSSRRSTPRSPRGSPASSPSPRRRARPPAGRSLATTLAVHRRVPSRSRTARRRDARRARSRSSSHAPPRRRRRDGRGGAPRRGLHGPPRVPEQVEPDPRFPTVAFPNPEEKGAMDLALALAEKVGADLVDRQRSRHRPVRGRRRARRAVDDAPRRPRGRAAGRAPGARAAATDAAGTPSPTPSCRRSILGAIAERHGLAHASTLTGFKWIARAEGLVFGYEEALGYCVAPDSCATRTASRGGGDRGPDGRARGRRADARGRARRHRSRVRRLRHRRRSRSASTTSSLIGRIMRALRSHAAHVGGRGRGRPGRRPRAGCRRARPERRPALLRGRRLARDRAPERHRAQAQGLPRGGRAGRRWRWRRHRPGALRAARETATARLAGIRADLEAATAL